MAAQAAPTYKLYYFNGRGRGETTRMMLKHADIAFDDTRLEFKDWPAVKPSMPFQRLPVLEISGVGEKPFKLAETGAIERYIARITNLYGSNTFESAQVDMILEALTEIINKYIEIIFGIKDEKEQATKLATFFSADLQKWNDMLTTFLWKEKEKEHNKFFVGQSVTVADIKFYNVYASLLVKNADCLKDHKALSDLVNRVAALPKIAAWIASRPATQF